MASYFDDHNIEESSASSRRRNTNRNPDISHFMSVSDSSNSSADSNAFHYVANLFNSFRMNIDDLSHRQFLDNLISQLMSETHTKSGPPPASKSFIESLPKIDHPELTFNESPICSICTDTYSSSSTVAKLPCSHHFDVSCITPWLQLHNTCPVCRHILPTDHKEEVESEIENVNNRSSREQEEDYDPDWMYG